MTAYFPPRDATQGVVDDVLRPVVLLGGSIYTEVNWRRGEVLTMADGFASRWPGESLAIVRHGASACRALLLELSEMRADAGVR